MELQGDTVKTIIFENCLSGIGIRIWGGTSKDGNTEKDYGIFVKRILPGSVADKNGELREGDLLLAVNDKSLGNVTNERAVQMLREAASKGRIILTVYRGNSAKLEYKQLLSSSILSSKQSFVIDAQDGSRHLFSESDVTGVNSLSVLQPLQAKNESVINDNRSTSNSEQVKLIPTITSTPRLNLGNDLPGSVNMQKSTSAMFSPIHIASKSQSLSQRTIRHSLDNSVPFLETTIQTQSKSRFTEDLYQKEDLEIRLAKLQLELDEQKACCQQLEEQLFITRREAQKMLEARRSMHTQLRIAEQNEKSVEKLEQDYDRVVKALERELANNGHRTYQTLKGNDVQDHQIALLNSQLLKMEFSQKTLDVACNKLLHFVEHVCDTLGNSVQKANNFSQDAHVLRTLTHEAHETIKVVRTLLESKPLPYGWEQCYTSDGRKYYVNHLTQSTSWSHPVSQINHSESPSPTSTNL